MDKPEWYDKDLHGAVQAILANNKGSELTIGCVKERWDSANGAIGRQLYLGTW